MSQQAPRLTPVAVVRIRSMIVAGTRSGFPCQFMLMNGNRQCSTRFHLLVSGRRWQTLVSKPSTVASFGSPAFHRGARELFEQPQQTAVSQDPP